PASSFENANVDRVPLPHGFRAVAATFQPSLAELKHYVVRINPVVLAVFPMQSFDAAVAEDRSLRVSPTRLASNRLASCSRNRTQHGAERGGFRAFRVDQVDLRFLQFSR